MRWQRLGLLLCALGGAALAHGQHGAAADDTEPRLWAQLMQAREAVSSAADGPSADFAQRRQAWEQLARSGRNYHRMYPGGRRSRTALELELEARFSLAMLRGAPDDFSRLISDYREHPPVAGASAEIDYWTLVLQAQLAADSPASAPATAAPAAVWRYAERHPTDRLTPLLLRRLFLEAADQGDLAQMRAVVSHLEAHFPQRPGTALLSGALRRQTALGQPFDAVLQASDGGSISLEPLRGRHVLIVAWSALSEDNETLLREIDGWQKAQPAQRAVIGVNLDGHAAQARHTWEAAGIEWPQLLEPRGPAGDFARRWGLFTEPTIFAIGPDGVLRGVGPLQRWREIATRPSGAD